MSNPFSLGSVVKEERFCNRVNELKELKQDILNNQNVLIYAPRRFGKTSLVLKAVEELKEEHKDFRFVYIDLMTITDKKEFINKYFNAIAKSLESSFEKTIETLKAFLRLKPIIKASISDTGNMVFSLDFSRSESDNVLDDILNTPTKYGEKYKVCIVFDEFQEIENIKGLENKLRSIIQNHSNVSYVFLGSKKSIINAMFSDTKRPFYKSVKHFTLSPISNEEWKKCILKSFETTSKKIDESIIDNILKVTKGFPYYTQQLCYEIWELSEKEVNEEIFNIALNKLLKQEREYFIAIWDNLTQNQKKALKIVLMTNGDNIYGDERSRSLISSASLQTAIKKLIEKDILDKKDRYYFQDPLFEYWLREERA